MSGSFEFGKLVEYRQQLRIVLTNKSFCILTLTSVMLVFKLRQWRIHDFPEGVRQPPPPQETGARTHDLANVLQKKLQEN